jgi:hypothetical protein
LPAGEGQAELGGYPHPILSVLQESPITDFVMKEEDSSFVLYLMADG